MPFGWAELFSNRSERAASREGIAEIFVSILEAGGIKLAPGVFGACPDWLAGLG